MWKIVDKKETLLNIVNGKIDINETDIKVLGLFEFDEYDESYVESIGDIQIETIDFLLSKDDIIFIAKV